MAFLTVNKGVGVAHQIPRNSLALLMVSQVVVILPLAIYISPWIVAVWLFCGYWRAQVYLGRWGYPAGWVKAVLVVGSTIGLGMSGYSTLGLEAATSLLVLAFSLKLVEMSNRRDAYLLIYLSYFLIANAFLFNQSMVLAGYEFLAAIVITAAVVIATRYLMMVVSSVVDCSRRDVCGAPSFVCSSRAGLFLRRRSNPGKWPRMNCWSGPSSTGTGADTGANITPLAPLSSI